VWEFECPEVLGSEASCFCHGAAPKRSASVLKLSLSWLAKARIRGDGSPYIKVEDPSAIASQLAQDPDRVRSSGGYNNPQKRVFVITITSKRRVFVITITSIFANL
jgi:hypothetical protein